MPGSGGIRHGGEILRWKVLSDGNILDLDCGDTVLNFCQKSLKYSLTGGILLPICKLYLFKFT